MFKDDSETEDGRETSSEENDDIDAEEDTRNRDIISFIDIEYVDILTGGFCCQFRFLIWFSFIGLFAHSIRGISSPISILACFFLLEDHFF